MKILDWARVRLQQWLGIHDSSHILREVVSAPCPSQTTCKILSKDYQNILQRVLDLQGKFDVLAEAFGVIIVGSLNGEDPKIISARENGLLGNAKDYINAAQIVDRVVAIQIGCLEEQIKIFDRLNRAANRAATKAMHDERQGIMHG